MISNPPQARQLRGHMPQRATARVAATAEHHAELTKHLQPRDLWLARMLFEHKVLTSHQIAELAWPSRRAANMRLRQLYQWRLIDRWQPFVSVGAAPAHYVLDVAGAVAVAREIGVDLRDIGYRHDRETGRRYSLQLAHDTGVNSVFTALIARARRPDATGTVTAWWSATRCLRLWGDLARPDAYGRWQQHGREDHREIEWFLEYDCASESLTKLAGKLAGYQRLATSTGIVTPVLVWLPSTGRETGARTALARALRELDQPHLVPVATTATDLTAPASALDPSAVRWLPITPAASARVALIDLTACWPNLAASAVHTATSTTNSTNNPGDTAQALPPAPSPMPPQQPRYPIDRSSTS